jgi:hypothetical protein
MYRHSMYVNSSKNGQFIQVKTNTGATDLINDSLIFRYLDVPAAPRAKTPAMAPNTICTQEPLMKEPRINMMLNEQMAKLNNFIESSYCVFFLTRQAAPAVYT